MTNSPAPFSAPGAGTPRDDRPPQIRAHHLEGLAAVYVRQSSPEQVRDHSGSTDAQRDLAELPRRWGWPDSRIRVIQDDLGLSGTTTAGRLGLRDLIEWMDRGAVTLVVVREVARLSRDPFDSEMFLRSAIRARVLIEANGRVYDTATPDLAELFGLRIQALLAWYENAQRVQVFQSAKTAKVRRGFAVTRPPIGHQESLRGKWILDPDPQIQHAIRRVLTLYLELRSVGRVVKAFRAAGLLFPRRQRGELTWEPITRDQVYDLITNPMYTGDYVYRRGAGRRTRVGAVTARPSIVFEAHHEAYISREDWGAIQADLAARRPAVRPPVGNGSALLQGLLVCGRCGRWMNPVYEKRAPKGHPLKRLPHYRCARADHWNRVDYHASCVAAPIDQAVVRHVLARLTPASIETALAEIEVTRGTDAEVHRARDRALRRAQDEVDEARRRHRQVGAEHGRVKVDLEAQYEAALARLETLKQTVAAIGATMPRTVTPDEATALVALTQTLPTLWKAPAMSNEDRKQLLRIVLARITLAATTPEAFHLDLEWIGGLREPLRVLRPQGVADLMVERAQAGQNAFAIARSLVVEGIGNVSGRPLTGPTVHHALKRRGALSKGDRIAVLQRIRGLVLEGRSRPEILAVVQAEAPSRLGPWTVARVRDAISRLREGVLGIPPLPASDAAGSAPGETRPS